MNKRDFSTKRINVFIVSVSTVLMLFVSTLPFKANKFGDMNFHIESKNVALFLKGKVDFDKVVITKAPGPILFYTPAYLLAPADATDDQLWLYAVIFLSIITTLGLLIIFRVGCLFFSKEVGLLAVLLFFIFPIHCYYSFGILAEIPAFFSLTLAIFGWALAYEEPHEKRGWLVLNFGMWLLIMNRPNAMLLLGILFVVVVYSYFKNKSFFENYGKKLALTFLIVTALSVGGLQLAKRTTLNKSGENQETLFYFVAHQGRFQFREEPLDFRFWDNNNRSDSKDYQNWVKSREELAAEMTKTNRSFAAVYKEFIITDALSHPFWFARQFFVKCMYGNLNVISKVKPQEFKLGPFSGVVGYWGFLLILNAINLFVLVGVALFLIQEKNWIHYWIFWGIAVSLLVFHGLTYMEPRYIFPSKVALYLMSAAGLYRIHWIKKVINKISVYMFPTSKTI
jgi:4-amino-4-deoxy-L-arabinose transferase-like glycosyltransferase